MTDAFAHIEAAITEVKTARRSVARKKTKQVTSADEIDRLKSVAYAWFQTHRPSVVDDFSSLDITAVNDAYKKVLDATGKHAARKTYATALQEAQNSLLAIRSHVATTPKPDSEAPSAAGDLESPPPFTPLAGNSNMQAILDRRWHEVQECVGCGAYLGATVMMGGLLESLLLARINASPDVSAVHTARGAPRDRRGRTLPLSGWKLVNMVEVACELNWITKSAKDIGHVLRDFRNYIHPHKEYTDGVVISEQDAHMFWEVTKAITRQLVGSVGKSP